MKTVKNLLVLLFVMSIGQAFGQSVDDILAKYYENIGGKEAWSNVKSLKMTAKVKAQGMEFPTIMLQKAPNKQKLTITFQGLEVVQPCFDGTTGWQTNFMTMSAEKMEAEDNEILKQQAEDFPDAFINYKQKGYKVELEGSETVDGTDCFKVKLTKKPIKIDGVDEESVSYYFFEKENYVPIMTRSLVQKGPGKGMLSETTFSDYQEVDGLIFPFSIEQKFSGQTQAAISVEKLEINPVIDDKVFSFPESK